MKHAISKDEIQAKALENAVSGDSEANYKAIFDGFEAKGIETSAILPRINVFTYKAWLAIGRVVKKGESGVKIGTVIECAKKDPQTGTKTPVKKRKVTTVFHVSQTVELGEVEQAPADDVQGTTAQEPQAAHVEVESVEIAVEQPREPNSYELKLEARRERYEDRAAGLYAESATARERARAMGSVIPFGQPILVGHHSERRDRNYRDKIHNTYGKSFALMDKADHYVKKAASVGTGGVSSDDPDAISKLKAQLAGAVSSQASMKAANKVVRSKKTDEQKIADLVELGFSEASAAQVLKPDFMGRVGFPGYALSNNNSNIKRIEGRINELEKSKQRTDVERAGNGFVYREDTSENRVMFIFPGKPDENIRKVLSGNAFNWSPSRNAWIRKMTANGLWAGKHVFDQLNK
jgi:hypothetical protein